LAIYDDNIRRGTMLGDDEYFPVTSVEWGADASQLFTYDSSNFSFELYVTEVTPAGVSIGKRLPGLPGGYALDLHYANELIYGDNGVVIDPVSGSQAGIFTAPGDSSNASDPQELVPDPAQNRAYMLSQNYGDPNDTYRLTAFDIDRYTPLRTVQITLDTSGRNKLLQWNDSLAILSYAGNVYLVDGAAKP
uniref:hypothetical protein n=1 Tax=Nevskia sp. TaxID=1929292 RepID=UPI0025CE404B